MPHPSAPPRVTRPGVAVVVPFFGDAGEAREALEVLGALRLGPEDVAVLADNTPGAPAAALPAPEGVRVHVCDVSRSAYGARNEAIDATRQPWILLLDADCRPVPDIVDRFFDPPVADGVGAVAGSVGGLDGQPGLVPAYARSRHHLDQQRLLTEHVFRPMAVTANVLVRREAWEDVGGFAEHVRSGADGDFCWRLQDAGWTLDSRPAAAAPHEHRADLGALLRKAARDGSANPWLAARWPGFPARAGVLRQLVRAAAAVPWWMVRGRPQRAVFKLVDVAWSIAADLGSLGSNAAPADPPRPDGRSTLVVREAPCRGAELPAGVRVEALRRPVAGQDWRLGRTVELRVAEDDGPAARLLALARLALRRPAGVVRAVAADARGAWLLAPAALRVARAGGPVLSGDAPDAAAVLRRLSGAR